MHAIEKNFCFTYLQLYAHRHFLFPALSIEEYNDRVTAIIRCEAQDALLHKFLEDDYLLAQERLVKDLILFVGSVYFFEMFFVGEKMLVHLKHGQEDVLAQQSFFTRNTSQYLGSNVLIFSTVVFYTRSDTPNK
ncbi:hypothetical protein EZV62_003553 [Acer yangbiense]|uniref:Uncharacterized protein n=1 Tax=Acer yangbiense TaxID=1000413 RepID=A0A5C7IHM9_9ROSI|nr:hypothetical protein EZV62_003553 [Acer yangbiense]